MHAEALAFIAHHLGAPGEVVEFGSLDVNGELRHLWPSATWTGVDIVDGPGVDVVADAAAYSSEHTVDVVVCAEVFEHTPWWTSIITAARNALTVGGTFIVTCACDPRAPHGAYDPDGSTGVGDEYYVNIDPGPFVAALAAHFRYVGMEVDRLHGDLRAVCHP